MIIVGFCAIFVRAVPITEETLTTHAKIFTGECIYVFKMAAGDYQIVLLALLQV